MARVGTGIAREVRRHRLARGMSAQQLSDACGGLGAAIPRTVISNIENGRRTNVSVAEVLVLARALDVPPIALVVPVGYEGEVEILPDRSADTLSAVDWISGKRLPPGQRDDAWPPGAGIVENWPVYLYSRHRYLRNKIYRLRKDAFEYETMFREGGKEASEVVDARQMADIFVGHLGDLRKQMVRRGLLLPEIPDVYAKQIEEMRQARQAQLEGTRPEASDDWGPGSEWPSEPPF